MILSLRALQKIEFGKGKYESCDVALLTDKAYLQGLSPLAVVVEAESSTSLFRGWFNYHLFCWLSDKTCARR